MWLYAVAINVTTRCAQLRLTRATPSTPPLCFWLLFGPVFKFRSDIPDMAFSCVIIIMLAHDLYYN